MLLFGYEGGVCGSLTEWWFCFDEKLRKMREMGGSCGSRLANCMGFRDIGGDAGTVLVRSCHPSWALCLRKIGRCANSWYRGLAELEASNLGTGRFQEESRNWVFYSR